MNKLDSLINSELKDILAVISQTEINEFSFEHDGTKLSFKRRMKTSVAEEVPAYEETSPQEEKKEELINTESKLVGIFKKTMVSVKDNLKKGQVIGYIEALGVMNEVKADTSGVVEEILVKDNQPVEYGQILLRLKSLL